MTWYILRHAEKEWGGFYNPKLRHQDEPISQKGRQQAEKLVEYFADKEISKIYISAYQRTGQTIAPVAGHLKLTPLVDERLNELDNGLFERATEEELREKFPMELQALRERKAGFRFPEGETGEEAFQRIGDFMQEKRDQLGDENLIIVAHDGLIRLLMCHVTNMPATGRWNFIDFCSITEIYYSRSSGPGWYASIAGISQFNS
jgi:broad specificity phosphatase PhoE